MKNSKILSIIIPVYNAEKYIVDCLNSIKLQEIDLEAICVNDGSTDGSETIIKNYMRENPFVKYIYQENSGAPAARNRGLQEAQGEYCMFFDADDFLLPCALEKLINKMEASNSDLVVGDYNEVDEYGNLISEIKQNCFVRDASVHWSFALCPPLPGNKLIRKTILDESLLKFESLKIGQDLNFYLKLITVAKNIVLLNESVMGYRIVEGSISRQYSLKILDICNSIDNVKEYYIKKNLYEAYQKYVSVTELIAYRSQLEKVKFFSDEKDVLKLCGVLEKKINKCTQPEKILNKVYFKEKVKCYLILIRYFGLRNVYKNK